MSPNASNIHFIEHKTKLSKSSNINYHKYVKSCSEGVESNHYKNSKVVF